MRYFFLNLTAAAFLIVCAMIGRAWVRRPKQTTMKHLFFVFAVLAIVSCKKSVDKPTPPPPPAKASVRFFSTNAVTSTKVITAKVNGTDYGRVTYSASMPACSAAGFGMVQLAPGIYNVDYLDPSNSMANKQVSITVPTGTTNCIFFDLK